MKLEKAEYHRRMTQLIIEGKVRQANSSQRNGAVGAKMRSTEKREKAERKKDWSENNGKPDEGYGKSVRN
jgi:hypothetical protein